MSNVSISATDLARNIAMSIDKVRMSGQSLDITKGTQVVATLSPPPKPGLSIAGLVKILSSLPTLADDSNTFAADLQTIKAQARLPENPWH